MATGSTVQLRVMRCFELRVDRVGVTLPVNVERVLAFLAVQERPQLRRHVATVLWMDTTEERAAANLRNALWRARQVLGGSLVADKSHLALSPEVDIDLRSLGHGHKTARPRASCAVSVAGTPGFY